MLTMYAIPNCDTVKKARNWLEEHGVEYVFHDYKKQGVPEKNLREWVKAQGWENVCNKKGMTWRKLDDAEKARIKDDATSIALMLEKHSVIKRPIIEDGKQLVVGFDKEAYEKAFL